MTGDMALISTEMFSSRLYKSAKRFRNSLLFKQSRTYKSQANRLDNELAKKFCHNNRYLKKNLYGKRTVDSPPLIHVPLSGIPN